MEYHQRPFDAWDIKEMAWMQIVLLNFIPNWKNYGIHASMVKIWFVVTDMVIEGHLLQKLISSKNLNFI